MSIEVNLKEDKCKISFILNKARDRWFSRENRSYENNPRGGRK